jgi:hypothetical protein
VGGLLSFVVFQLAHPDGMPLFSFVLFLPSAHPSGCGRVAAFCFTERCIPWDAVCLVCFYRVVNSDGTNLFP